MPRPRGACGSSRKCARVAYDGVDKFKDLGWGLISSLGKQWEFLPRRRATERRERRSAGREEAAW
jgi:hypothetical protein